MENLAYKLKYVVYQAHANYREHAFLPFAYNI